LNAKRGGKPFFGVARGRGPITDQSIEELLRRFQDGRIPRRRLVVLLAAAGASAAGVATLLASAQAQHRAAVEQQNIQLHQRHVTQRSSGPPPSPSAQHRDAARAEALRNYLADYADDAVVEDPMLPQPVVGKEAIG
jgi:hypothetical protein